MNFLQRKEKKIDSPVICFEQFPTKITFKSRLSFVYQILVLLEIALVLVGLPADVAVERDLLGLLGGLRPVREAPRRQLAGHVHLATLQHVLDQVLTVADRPLHVHLLRRGLIFRYRHRWRYKLFYFRYIHVLLELCRRVELLCLRYRRFARADLELRMDSLQRFRSRNTVRLYPLYCGIINVYDLRTLEGVLQRVTV